MSEPDPLRVEYTTVSELIELLTYVVETVSLGFDRWEEEYVSGPGLYFVLVRGVHSGSYANPLGKNRWPVETCRLVTKDLDGFVEGARRVGLSCDGAVVVSMDGTIQEQMVRVKSLSPCEEEATAATITYSSWMGTKHLSAVEASVREEVVATITLSEENGRMTIFENGEYEDYQRDELGGVWRSTD
ncbi:hypothetical protein Halar_3103 [halophilic archaeon DL31]|jgi:hypothetical protein|nr:hypothetical protein Halar_3103 [halophilic archaeon DL31]